MISKFGKILVGIVAVLLICCWLKNTSTAKSVTQFAQPDNSPQSQKNKLAKALEGLAPRNGKCALLVGFDTDTSDNAAGYGQFYDYQKPDLRKIIPNKTLLLTRKEQQVRLVAKLDFIASPQPAGFLYLGQTRYFEPKPRIKNQDLIFPEDSKIESFGFDYTKIWQTTAKNQITAAQAETRGAIKAQIDNKFRRSKQKEWLQNISDYEKISFVGENYYVKEGFWSQIHGGAAFFDAYSKVKIVFLTAQKFSVRLTDWYSAQEVESYYRKSLDAEVVGREKQLSAEEKENYLADLRAKLAGKPIWGWGIMPSEAEKTSDGVNTPTFTFVRARGKTIMQGLSMMEGNAHRAFHETIDLGAAPKKLVRYDNPDVNFVEFQQIYPDAIDVFVSPNQNTVFVLTKNEIIGIDVAAQQEIYREEHNLNFNKVVMVEWATNNFVEKWENELK